MCIAPQCVVGCVVWLYGVGVGVLVAWVVCRRTFCVVVGASCLLAVMGVAVVCFVFSFIVVLILLLWVAKLLVMIEFCFGCSVWLWLFICPRHDLWCFVVCLVWLLCWVGVVYVCVLLFGTCDFDWFVW